MYRFDVKSPYLLDETPQLTAAELRALAGKSIFFDGVFIGNYSLAIVNRHLTRALLRAGLKVSCFTPEKNWKADPALSGMLDVKSRMLDSYPAAGDFDIHLRNTWPPETSNMIGRFNAYVCFAWEECEVPLYMIDRFNQDLDLVMVTSNFVQAAFRHSGLTIPVQVVSNGCDHILGVTPAAKPPLPKSAGKRILHVSTCLPRKGADRLVEAFARSFDADAGVELVVKTEANPHNRIHALAEEARAAYPKSAPIRIIEGSLTPEELAALYRTAAVLVLPSRGEGFGLPLAEALLHGVPVAATNYSGQMDFCTEETSFPIDYVLVPSKAHVSGPYSLWAEPSLDSISRQIKSVLDNPVTAWRRTGRAKQLIRKHFTWDKTAERVMKSLARVEMSPRQQIQTRSWSVDLTSTWRQRCGIATYSEHLFDTDVLRPHLASVFAREVTAADALPAGHGHARGALPTEKRVWNDRIAGVNALCRLIRDGKSEVFWFQHHPGQFSANDMKLVLAALDKSAYKVRAITMHNVLEMARAKALDWVRGFDVVFVHSANDGAMLSEAGHRNPVVIPHGIAQSGHNGGSAGSDGSYTIGTFGFLFPHKNIEALITAVAIAREYIPKIRLKLLNSVVSSDSSELVRARVETLIRHFGLEDCVSTRFDFMNEADVVNELHACNLIAFVYGDSSETATGAARIALMADRPMLCSDSSVLSDLHSVSHVLAKNDPRTIAEALVCLSSNKDLLGMLDGERSSLVRDFSFGRLAQRYAAHIDAALNFRT